MRLLVCYDIVSDRRRARVHDLLLEYGTPVQYSVFECEVAPREIAELKQRVRKLVAPRFDSVRFYRLCRSCAGQSDAIPRDPPPRSSQVV